MRYRSRDEDRPNSLADIGFGSDDTPTDPHIERATEGEASSDSWAGEELFIAEQLPSRPPSATGQLFPFPVYTARLTVTEGSSADAPIRYLATLRGPSSWIGHALTTVSDTINDDLTR